MDVYIFAGIGLFGVLFIILSFVMGELGHLVASATPATRFTRRGGRGP